MGAKCFGVAVALCALAALGTSSATASVKTYSRVFAPGDLNIFRAGNAFQGFVVDGTRASISGPTTAGAGDEIHIVFKMAPGSALKFNPTGDEYYVEAYLFNSGGGVSTVGASQITYTGTNINNQPGALDYETPSPPSWRASRWAERTNFFLNSTQPAVFTQIEASFTIPAGYPTASFTEVYMNIGAQKQLFFGQQPPAQMMLQTTVPEPASVGLLAIAAIPLARRRR
jgi:hypothetical protein